MDVVRTVNESNLILPAGDVTIGPYDYNLYSNSQVPNTDAINSIPLKSVGQNSVLVSDIGKAVDSHQIQTNIVRVDGQRSVYLPILKQGGDTNTTRGGRRNPKSNGEPSRHSEAAHYPRGVRSIDFRQDGD